MNDMSNTPRILDLDIELPLLSNSIIVDEKIAEHNADEEAHPYILGVLGEKANSADLATVATTGDYDDLENKPDIEDIAGSVAGGAVSAHNQSEDAHTDIRNEIGTVKEIAEGANIAIVFDNYEALVTFFNSESDSLKVGTNLYVKTVDVPDLWISAVESESVSYTYTTDADFLTYINGNGQIGYYKFSELETQKVDLSNYATLTDLGTKVAKSGDTMTGDLTMDGAAVIVKGGNYWFKLIQDTTTITISSSNNNGQTWSPCLQMWNAQNKARFKGSVYANGGDNEENKLQQYSEIYVTGIVSDTKTWTTDADGKYYYTLTNPVSGPIPKAFITEWNVKCSLYSCQGAGKFNANTGYFEANGLTDITYEEAIVILAESSQLSMVQTNYKNSRTNLGLTMNSWSANRQWQNSNTEVIYLANTTMTISSATSTFITSCPHLKKIIYSRWDYVSGTLTLGSCPSLEDIELTSASRGPKGSLDFRQAPNITLTTMVNFVTGAQNTSAVTWRTAGNTLSACTSDTTEYSYGGSTYTGIVAYAAAKSISITN